MAKNSYRPKAKSVQAHRDEKCSSKPKPRGSQQIEHQRALPDQVTHLQNTHTPENFEELMTWRIRWYLIMIITIVYVSSFIAIFIGYSFTKDPHYMYFIVPPSSLTSLFHRIIPMDKKQYELKLAKINAAKELSEARGRIETLETKLRK
jgi:hypothetical protein